MVGNGNVGNNIGTPISIGSVNKAGGVKAAQKAEATSAIGTIGSNALTALSNSANGGIAAQEAATHL